MAEIMYSMKPVYHAIDVKELPTCMYKMNNYHTHTGNLSTDGSLSEVQVTIAAHNGNCIVILERW